MSNRKTVLIVDDSAVFRKTLSAILKDTYDVIIAEDGRQAYDMVCKKGKEIDLVFLDIMMPVLDGYGFLKKISEDGKFIDIPIVITTSNNDLESEVKCLEMGAAEVVVKPYNPDVVKTRAASLIRLRETSALLQDMRIDSVTGALSKNAFYERIAEEFKENPDKDYDLSCLNIEGYELLRDRYGDDKCDEMHKSFYEVLLEAFDDNYIIGRLDESKYGILGPAEGVEAQERHMKDCMSLSDRAVINGVIVDIGLYHNVDKTISVETACRNAIMAAESIEDQYGVYISVYDDALRDKILKERFIIDNMIAARDERQFKVYYQPKFDLNTSRVSGAEALVRWIHPDKGFMNPGEFISIFEHNGFIQELDRYMIESVCADMREWISKGLKIVPVSINLSQANFDNIFLSDEIEKVVDSYEIPHEMIHFEITESMNAADANKKYYTVSRLREKGFLIELDDFGSGYSSLSTLSDLSVDVVKLDMSLIQKMFEKKHSAVLSGALFTARELTLKVVAEGVETSEQVQELKWRGSHIKEFLIQGYYFSKPVPKNQYEEFLADTPDKEEVTVSESQKKGIRYSTVNLKEIETANDGFNYEMQNKMYKALMEIPGGVMYEYNPNSDEMTIYIFEDNGVIRKRSTDRYFENLRKRHWVHESYVESYIDTIRMVYTYRRPKGVMASALMQNGEYRICNYHFAPIMDDDGNVFRVVGRGEVVDYATNNDVLSNMPVGTFRYSAEGNQEFEYISESLVFMLGFENEMAFRKAYNNSFLNFVHEEDRERVLKEIDDQIAVGNIDYCEYRVIKADGSIMWLYDRGTFIVDENGKKWFYVAVADLDDYKQKQLKRQRSQDRMIKKYKSDAHHDKMTRLDNHEYSLHLIKKYLDQKDTGIFFLFDIDDFKIINDTRGHVIGDQILVAFADILRSTFREGDVVGRYGGDEFICYMPEVSSRSVAKRKASSILDKVKSIMVDERHSLSVSIGIVENTAWAENTTRLVEMGDKALYKVKNTGKSGFAFFDYEGTEE